jgi:hypothetical protein
MHVPMLQYVCGFLVVYTPWIFAVNYYRLNCVFKGCMNVRLGIWGEGMNRALRYYINQEV